MIMEYFFHVPPILSEDIVSVEGCFSHLFSWNPFLYSLFFMIMFQRNMVGSLDEHEDIFKTATLCELDNLAELKKIHVKSVVPKFETLL